MMIYELKIQKSTIILDLKGRDYEFGKEEYAWFNIRETTKHTSHGRYPTYSFNKQNNEIVWKILWEGESLRKHIGNVGLHNINHLNRSAEIAIFIGNSSCRGKGFCADILKCIIGHGFVQLNLNRIYLGTSEHNIPMIKAAKRVGMIEEGIRRQAVWKNGQFNDIKLFSILKNEREKVSTNTITDSILAKTDNLSNGKK